MEKSPILIVMSYIFEVQCCLFFGFHVGGDGGAIRVYGTDSGLKCKKCVFMECTASSQYGAIYFSDIASEGMISQCLFYNCDSGAEHAIGGITALRPTVELVSINLCGNLCPNVVFALRRGIQVLANSNSTNTYATHHSGFHLSESDVIAKVKYVHVGNHRNCQFNYGFYGPSSDANSSYVNIVNNTASIGLVYLYATDNHLLINYIFSKNSGCVTSNNGGWPGTCSLINCCFYESSCSRGNYMITMVNPKFSTSPPTYEAYLYSQPVCSGVFSDCPTIHQSMKSFNGYLLFVSFFTMEL